MLRRGAATNGQLAHVAFAWVLLLLPAMVWGQSATSGAIAGVVKDPTGAVLPGVTVEAASPALIERVRTAITDSEGQYRVVDLRPGTYRVTFSLAGFNTLARDNVVLTTGFTAAVDVEMRVGAVTETVIVTGASPLVDVQNVHGQNVLSRATLDILPTNRTNQGFAALTLGALAVGSGAQDVGGNKGDTALGLQIHGSRSQDGKKTIDGMLFVNIDSTAGGPFAYLMVNQHAMQETTLTLGDASPEWETGGVNTNFVPKDGGNKFRVEALVNGTTGALQATNLDDRLRARDLTSAPQVKEIFDVGVGAGGPIIKDRVWFYSTYRNWHSKEYQPSAYFNRIQSSLFYEPDLSRPGYTDTGGWDGSLRLT